MPITLNIPFFENRPGFERLELLNVTASQIRFALVGRRNFIREAVAVIPPRMAAQLGAWAVQVIHAAPIHRIGAEQIEIAASYAPAGTALNAAE